MVLPDIDISRLFMSRKVEMMKLKDQGYDVSGFDINMSQQDFLNTCSQNLDREHFHFHKVKQHNYSEHMHVFYPKEAIGVKKMMTYFPSYHSKDVFKAIFVGGSRDINSVLGTQPPRYADKEASHMAVALKHMAVAVASLTNKAMKEDNFSKENVIRVLHAIPDLDASVFLEDERRARVFLALAAYLRKKWLLRKLRSQ